MPPTPSQIRELLLRAIDEDDNIVDMGSVTKAISLLESHPITKDALEETRLGKLVNSIRKKTSSSNLKKRCTALIKQWQSQFLAQSAAKSHKSDSPATVQDDAKVQEGSSTSSAQNSKPVKPTPNAVSSVDKNKSENQKRRKREKEPTNAVSPSLQPPPEKRIVVSPGQSSAVTEEGNGQDDSSLNGISCKGETQRTTGKTKVTAVARSASPHTAVASPSAKRNYAKERKSATKTTVKQGSHVSPRLQKKEESSINTLSPNVPVSQKDVSSRNKQLSNITSGNNSKQTTLSPGSNRSLVQRHSDRGRDKLLTPSQLAQSSSASPASGKTSGSGTPRQLGSCSVSVESQQQSPGTDSSESRSHFSEERNVYITDWDTTSFDLGTSGDGTSQFSLFDEPSSEVTTGNTSKSTSIFDVEFTESVEPEVFSADRVADSELSFDKVDSGMSINTPFSGVCIESKAEHMVEAQAEPVVSHEFYEYKQETLEDEPMTPPRLVTQEEIDHIHDEPWEGVNGCYNDRGEWFDWMQCLTVDTGEDNTLHILPYVCID